MIDWENVEVRRKITEWLVAFSLTNCYLWPVWSSYLSPSLFYFEPDLAKLHLRALLLISLAIPSIALAIVEVSRRSNLSAEFRTSTFAFGLLSLPLIIGSIAICLRLILPDRVVLLASWICVLLLSATLQRWITKIGFPMMKILAPVAIVLFLHGLYSYARTPSNISNPDKISGPVAQPVDPHPLIVTIVFDEMDGGVTSQESGNSPSLPNLKAFQDQALNVTTASSPGMSTIVSIPSLLTGIRIIESTPILGPDLQLKTVDGRSTRLTRESTLFDDLRKSGRRAAITGWYHPYCALFKSSVAECLSTEWTSMAGGRPLIGRTLKGAATDIAYGSLAYLNTRLAERRTTFREYHRHVLSAVTKAADEEIQSGHCSFVFVHLPVPHPPFLADIVAGQSTYQGNLQIADQAFGDLRGVLERTGKWNDATIIVTSDHFWREEMWSKSRPVWGGRSPIRYPSISKRVPLMIKLPRQTVGVTYTRELNNIVLRQLTNFVVEHPTATPQDLVAWLDSIQSKYSFGPVGSAD